MAQIMFCKSRVEDISDAREALHFGASKVANLRYTGLNSIVIHRSIQGGITVVSLIACCVSASVSQTLTSTFIAFGLMYSCGFFSFIISHLRKPTLQQIFGAVISKRHPEIEYLSAEIRSARDDLEPIEEIAGISNAYETLYEQVGPDATIKCEYNDDDKYACITITAPEIEKTSHIGTSVEVVEKRKAFEKKWYILRKFVGKIFREDCVDFSWVDGEYEQARQRTQLAITTTSQKMPKLVHKAGLALPEEAHVDYFDDDDIKDEDEMI